MGAMIRKQVGTDLVRNFGKGLNHTCKSEISHVRIDKGGLTVQIDRVTKYNCSISQGLWDNSWHKDVLKISRLVNAYHAGNLAAIISNA